MKKIAIISSGYFPVPAVKCGAVETLIEKLIISNELNHFYDFEVYSTFDKQAEKLSDYRYTKVEYIRDDKLMEKIDNIIYAIARIFIKSSKQMSFRYIMHRIKYIWCVSKRLRDNNYDYVLIENTATLFWCLKLFGNAKRYKDKILYHVHNEVHNTFGCKKLICKSRTILGVSQYINKSLEKKFVKIDKNKFRVLYNVVDLEKLETASKKRKYIREKYRIKDEEIVFLFAGRICKEKGIYEVINAFSHIKNDNVKLIVAGNYYFGTNLVNDFEKKIHDMVEKYKEKVIFTGFIPNKEIGAYYSAADITILPSIWEEPAGLTVLESMAATSGVTITTNSGGIPEYMGNKNGIILDKNNPEFIENLTFIMNEMINDEKQRKEYEKLGKKRVKKFNYIDYIKYFRNCIE